MSYLSYRDYKMNISPETKLSRNYQLSENRKAFPVDVFIISIILTKKTQHDIGLTRAPDAYL